MDFITLHCHLGFLLLIVCFSEVGFIYIQANLGSQSHMKAGKDLFRSSCPTPYSNRVTYGRSPGTLLSQVFNISKHGNSTATLDNISQYSITLTVKMFSCVKREFNVFEFVPIASHPATGHYWEAIWLNIPHSMYWCHSSPGAGLGTFLCRTSWDSGWPVSPACPGPPEQQHNHLVYCSLL